jgi:hypothetical protein
VDAGAHQPRVCWMGNQTKETGFHTDLSLSQAEAYAMTAFCYGTVTVLHVASYMPYLD